MANTTINGIRRNFSGGEVASTIASRDDLAKYSTSCAQLVNFIPQLHGGARYRTGTEFVGDIGGKAKLIPFAFNTDDEDTYMLVFVENRVYFVQDGGVISQENEACFITTPYLEAEIELLDVAQSADVMYVAHPNHPLRKLVRSGHDSWDLHDVSIESKVPAPNPPVITWRCNAGDDGNFQICCKVTAVDADGIESVGSGEGCCINGKPPSEWVEKNWVEVAWEPVEGAEEYNVYKEDHGVFGYMGTAKLEEGASYVYFRDNNYTPDATSTVQSAKNPFADGNNPALVGLHKQRLWISGSSEHPTTLYGSRIGDFENFNVCRPLQDDDALELTIASGSLNKIEWATPFGDLLVGTTGGEYRMYGGAKGEQITAKEQNLKAESYWGSAAVQPIVIGNSILHITRLRGRVRDLFWSLEKDGYSGNDLSILAAHLFDGRVIKNWAYQQEPDSLLFAVRDDGIALGLTYLKEHEIWGWFRVETQGEFQQVCTIPNNSRNEDSVYFVTKRTVRGEERHYLERLRPKWRGEDGIVNANYLDSSLSYHGEATDRLQHLEHLEGETVMAFADGNVVEGLVVENGTIDLPQAASTVHVGLPYEGILEPLPIEMDLQTGTTQGEMRGIGRVRLRLYDSVGGQVHSGNGVLDDIKYPNFERDEVEPFTGVVSQNVDNTTSDDATIIVVQNKPRPLTIMAIIQEISL